MSTRRVNSPISAWILPCWQFSYFLSPKGNLYTQHRKLKGVSPLHGTCGPNKSHGFKEGGMDSLPSVSKRLWLLAEPPAGSGFGHSPQVTLWYHRDGPLIFNESRLKIKKKRSYWEQGRGSLNLLRNASATDGESGNAGRNLPGVQPGWSSFSASFSLPSTELT